MLISNRFFLSDLIVLKTIFSSVQLLCRNIRTQMMASNKLIILKKLFRSKIHFQINVQRAQLSKSLMQLLKTLSQKQIKSCVNAVFHNYFSSTEPNLNTFGIIIPHFYVLVTSRIIEENITNKIINQIAYCCLFNKV